MNAGLNAIIKIIFSNAAKTRRHKDRHFAYHAGKRREEATAGVGTDALKFGIKIDQLVENHLRVFLCSGGGVISSSEKR